MSNHEPVVKQIRSRQQFDFNLVNVKVLSITAGIAKICFTTPLRDEIHRLAAGEHVAIPHMEIFVYVISVRAGGYVDVSVRPFQLSDVPEASEILEQNTKLTKKVKKLDKINSLLKEGQDQLRLEKSDLVAELKRLKKKRKSKKAEEKPDKKKNKNKNKKKKKKKGDSEE